MFSGLTELCVTQKTSEFQESKEGDNAILKVPAVHCTHDIPPMFSAYRKIFSCQNVLLRLIEQWRQYLDNNKVVGAVLMDLSKAFDCLPHELLIAKLEAYGLDRQVVKLIYSYLKDRKQTVKIKGFFGVLKTIISGCASRVYSWSNFVQHFYQ